MGKRLYLANGFVAGTLTKEEITEAENNSIVMQQVKYLESRKNPKTKMKRKVVRNG